MPPTAPIAAASSAPLRCVVPSSSSAPVICVETGDLLAEPSVVDLERRREDRRRAAREHDHASARSGAPCAPARASGPSRSWRRASMRPRRPRRPGPRGGAPCARPCRRRRRARAPTASSRRTSAADDASDGAPPPFVAPSAAFGIERADDAAIEVDAPVVPRSQDLLRRRRLERRRGSGPGSASRRAPPREPSRLASADRRLAAEDALREDLRARERDLLGRHALGEDSASTARIAGLDLLERVPSVGCAWTTKQPSSRRVSLQASALAAMPVSTSALSSREVLSPERIDESRSRYGSSGIERRHRAEREQEPRHLRVLEQRQPRLAERLRLLLLEARLGARAGSSRTVRPPARSCARDRSPPPPRSSRDRGCSA